MLIIIEWLKSTKREVMWKQEKKINREVSQEEEMFFPAHRHDNKGQYELEPSQTACGCPASTQSKNRTHNTNIWLSRLKAAKAPAGSCKKESEMKINIS